MGRSKKALLNLISQLLVQAVTAVCGFIVPKLMLESFGSELNGIITSISQFLGIIALMESGFGSVAKTAFYKPLALNDINGISGVYNATESFFHKIAFVFFFYCCTLALIFPHVKETEYNYYFIASLVLITGISSFMQYYLGMSYTILLNADQCSYISAFWQVITIICNAVLTVILLKLDASIHIVKLASASVFVFKPIIINLYGRHKYRIDPRIPKNSSSIAQKWDNFGQSIAMYVHTKTDYLLITVFLTFQEVSVYSVYSLITGSLSSVITSISTGFVSGLGNIYASKEKANFDKIFSLYEFVNTIVTFLFYTIAIITMSSFVRIYTVNLNDAEYSRPLFGVLLIVGELIYCLRLPYYYMITNAGHFKQMKKSAYIEAALNIVISCALLPIFGILGLAIGTAIGMIYRTSKTIIYCTREITGHTIGSVLNRIVVNAIGSIIVIRVSQFFYSKPGNFYEWIIYAVFIGILSTMVLGIINIWFYRNDFDILCEKLKSLFKK